jgi:hypothetical protein
MIISDIIPFAVDYRTYVKAIMQKHTSGMRSGGHYALSYFDFLESNIQRMSFLDKALIINPIVSQALESLNNKLIWLVIAEGWSTDCSEILPVINKLAEASKGKIYLKIVSMENYPDQKDISLFNEVMSLPKMMFVDSATLNVLANWGPRPAPAQKIVMEWQESEISWQKNENDLQLWYLNDNGETTIIELLEIINTLH